MRKLLVVLLFGVSCLQAQGSADAAIRKANAEFVRLFNAGQVDELVRLYTSDAEVLAPNAEVASGTAAIGGLFKALAAGGFKDLTLETSRVEQCGNWAFERGAYTMTTPQGKDRGKYLVVWKRVPKAGWHLHIDTFSSNLPAPK